ncbi:hypothetical protein [Pseudosulfitobacter sp. SM2401]|uniref:hypothetical protein n=1 Tax=Pseudosulfitobacter sp. SM2401 TaxID=3350098 RepID=UPI002A2FACB5|nr:hypothetical protein [Ascidiaceihabitans sp.]
MKFLIGLVVVLGLAGGAQAQSADYGDDTSEWANDGECDDRRFTGAGVTGSLDSDDSGHDATDCKRAVEFGRAKLWVFADAIKVTQCDAVNFGDDSSEWAKDRECDDFRFEGDGMSAVVLSEDIGRDAADCRRLCDAGKIALRDY